MIAQKEITSNTNIDSIDFFIIKQEFLQALVKGKHKLCTNLMHVYIYKDISIQQVYENIFKAALYDVGEQWENNKISVATEHMASAIIETLMNQLYPQIVAYSTGEKIVM